MLFTTPHAITFLMDSFNVVRCSRVGITFTLNVVPDNSSNSRGHLPLLFHMVGEDIDAASTDKINVDTTNLAELMLDKYGQMKRILPWFNDTVTDTYDHVEFFFPRSIVEIKAQFVWFQKARFFARKGTSAQAVAYSLKEKTRAGSQFIFGVPSKQGARTDLEECPAPGGPRRIVKGT